MHRYNMAHRKAEEQRFRSRLECCSIHHQVGSLTKGHPDWQERCGQQIVIDMRYGIRQCDWLAAPTQLETLFATSF